MGATNIRPHLTRLATLLLVLFTLTGCTLLPTRSVGRASSALQEEATPTPIPTPIAVAKPTYTVTRGEVIKQMTLTGRIAPVIQQNLFFKVSGRVQKVYVETGDMVKAGQLLAQLEVPNVERDLVGSQLELARVQDRLKIAEVELQQEVKRAQANLDIAKENLAIIKAQDPTPRKTAAEVALQRADLERQQAQAAYDAIAWRNDRGATPQAMALQQATLNYTAVQAAYDLTLQDIVVHAHQITIAQRQVDLAQLVVDGLSEGVDPLLVNDVNKAQLAVDKLQASIFDAQIVAPFDGEVQVAFVLSEGVAIDAFSHVATVSDLTELEARVDTINIEPGQLSAGMPVTVSLLAQPGVGIQGRIRRLPAIGTLIGVDQDRSLHIALESNDASVVYRTGDLMRVVIVLEQKLDVLWLSPAAIRTFEGRRFVVVQEGSGQRRVDIQVGIEGEGRIEITDGLTEGQIVVGQ